MQPTTSSRKPLISRSISSLALVAGLALLVPAQQAAATGLSPVGVSIQSACPVGAGPGSNGAVQTSFTFQFTPGLGYLVGLFGGTGLSGQTTLSARGVMPCET